MCYLTTSNNGMSDWNDIFEGFWDNFTSPSYNVPSVDVKENEKVYEINADLPGFSKKDVNLKVEKHILTISSKPEETAKEEKDQYLLKERYLNSFERQFPLPDDIDENSINAEFSDGVLTVTLPKKPEVQPRNIEIKVS